MTMGNQTRYLSVVAVNDEPGIMEPGHCFTIEVGSDFWLPWGIYLLICLTACNYSRFEPTRVDISRWLGSLDRSA